MLPTHKLSSHTYDHQYKEDPQYISILKLVHPVVSGLAVIEITFIIHIFIVIIVNFTEFTIKIPRPLLEAAGLTIQGPRYLLWANNKSRDSRGKIKDCGTMSKCFIPRRCCIRSMFL